MVLSQLCVVVMYVYAVKLRSSRLHTTIMRQELVRVFVAVLPSALAASTLMRLVTCKLNCYKQDEPWRCVSGVAVSDRHGLSRSVAVAVQRGNGLMALDCVDKRAGWRV
jgi:hypothetical protein